MRRVSSPTFVGRAEQLAAFDSALARAAGGRPGVLLLAGESGVGKTRLVGELARRALERDARVLTGDCVELGEGELPYAPLAAALREVGLTLPLDSDEVADLERFSQSRLFERLLALLAELSDERPLVLVVEDLHWADRSTRDFLAFLSRALRQERLLLVVTYRSDELHRRHPLRPLLAELERLERVERLDLTRFSRGELVAQLTGILGARPDARLVEELWERAEGNAFFTEELLAAGETADARALPETLRDALMVRVERLPEGAQRVVRVAAASGRGVSHPLLGEVAGLEGSELLGSVREAVGQHVLVQRDGQGYGFRHALIREAVYDDLLPGERGELHLRLAEALARDPSLSAEVTGAQAELAWHWRQAHDLPRALRASVAAAADARRLQAPAEAARHLDGALELWDRVDG
ncbi:MAG: ATP-binding protein, partial [Nocardioidaceae bacterium]